jgi:hypothetical protein
VATIIVEKTKGVGERDGQILHEGITVLERELRPWKKTKPHGANAGMDCNYHVHSSVYKQDVKDYQEWI